MPFLRSVHQSLCLCFVPPCVSQETWQKAMLPLCEWAMQSGPEVVKVVERLQQKGRVAPTSFLILAQFRDPADYSELLNTMIHESTKCNLAQMRQVAGEILQRRYWLWVLCHPQLGADYIHPTRRVPSLLLLCVWS